MKKIYSFVFAAVALFSAASCQDELVNNETPTVQGEKFTITAIADAQTKTALTDEGFNSVWTPGDAIAVIDFTGQGAEFTTAITKNATSAKFTCEDFNVGGMADISALPIVALYPYQAGLTCSIQSQQNPSGDNTIKGITFPNEQTAVAGSFDKTAAFTWAMATGATKDNLVFNNLYSLLKVKVTEEDITEIKVTATSGSLAGNVTLPITQSGTTLTVVDGEGKSEVTLTCEAGFDTEKYYYICVLPGTYEGFSIALNGYTVKTKASAATFAAATVYDLGAVARTKSSWKVMGTPSWDYNSAISMYVENNMCVAKNVAITGGKFKFNNGSQWLGVGAISVNQVSRLWDGDDIEIENGNYDIYLAKDTNKENSDTFGFFFVVPSGTDISKNSPNFNYGVVGNGDWNNDCAKFIFDYRGYFVAKDVTISSAFKIRENNSWDTSWGSGNKVTSEPSKIYHKGADSSADPGTYDIYTDFCTIWIVSK